MGLLRFDEVALRDRLGWIPAVLRATFAASSAQRLLPAYLVFAQKMEPAGGRLLVSLLDQLWWELEEGKAAAVSQMQRKIAIATGLIPGKDAEGTAPGQAYAEDAAAAVTYALRCQRNGEAQEAAWAARRVYEALDHFVIAQEKIDVNHPGAEKQILAHPLIQVELLRQRRDIDALMNAKDQNFTAVIKQLRERAKVDAAYIAWTV
jgi:uncharacterized protein YjaG (DUF416 family)